MNQALQWILDQKWYGQSFPGKPLFLTAPSITAMQKGLGFSYSAIFGAYEKGYVEGGYILADIESCAKKVLENLEKNPDYLLEKQRQYNAEIEGLQPVFRQSQSDLSKLSDKELVQLVHQLGDAIDTAVGTAHLLESLSYELERLIRHWLKTRLNGTELNESFSILTSPVTYSFLSEKEEALWKIRNALKKQQSGLVQRFIADFFWVNASYTGSDSWTPPLVLEAAGQLNSFAKPNLDELKKQKRIILERLQADSGQRQWIAWTELAVDWQDQRKKNILIGIYGLEQAASEVSKRFRIDLEILKHLYPYEFSVEGLRDGSLAKTGKKRLPGCVLLVQLQKFQIFDGNDFVSFQKIQKAKKESADLVNGTSASLGTATGRVRICTNIESIGRVREGDILIASMTRPEFVPAMKKAAAIVTDEGGVTCHAAIVSRELGKPCVIGTRIATRVFHDGDIVEVNANHGIVRKLENWK